MRVEQMVRQLVGECSEDVHASRLKAVVKVVEGVIAAGRLSPASVGRRLPGQTSPKHGIKRVDRLVGNPRLAMQKWSFLAAIARHLVSGCARPVILVDWTQVSGDHQGLVAAVPVGGRALPIYFEVHPLKKLGNAAVEASFLASLRSILPANCLPIIVSDAGFKGPFFEAVQALGWDFLGRVRGTAKAVTVDGQVISKKMFYARASITPKELGRFGLFVGQQIDCRLVLVRKRRKPGPKPPPPRNKEEREMRQSALDPWLLATSLADGDAAYVVSLYAKRMQIEECFRDAKNHRFGWSLSDVRTASLHRAAVILLLAVIAMVVVTLIGLNAERRGIHRTYQANSIRHRRVLSLFVLACTLLARGAAADRPTLLEFRACLAILGRAANS
jgi:Transposase DDE domain